ncbi:hypothetical protein [Tropicibacter alexandrii]|uniref:hypothetical protein n=1 Tax=Tropicibacter alexandrii TaxID=2267683 RepID=UPI0010092C23|nr:hypothetical protein [Tropicibacter alexandrii]
MGSEFKIALYGDTEPPNSQVNSGAWSFEKSSFMDRQYCGGLYLPNNDWADSQTDYARVTKGSFASCLHGDTITLLALPDQIITGFYREYIPLLTKGNIVEAQKCVRENTAEKIVSSVLEELEVDADKVEKSVVNLTIRHLFRSANIAQRTSSTGDSQNPNQVRGLHVDNWETPRKLIPDRCGAGLKLIVNIGTEARHFVFLNYRADAIYKDHQDSGFGALQNLIINSDFASPIADWFLGQFPSTGLIRIKLEPGMAVLAPVQNAVHDGDLSGKAQPDAVCMISFKGSNV